MNYERASFVTAPATDAAKQWEGWGTALKPAWEPIVLARKPLVGTVVENVLAHGTGGINIGACRIEHLSEADRAAATPQGKVTSSKRAGGAPDVEREGRQNVNRPDTSTGRFPANFLHDGSPEVLSGFPQTTSGALSVDVQRGKFGQNGIYGAANGSGKGRAYAADSGSAARFFYCAKASKTDRAGSLHPTVKPVALMRWLCRLITPPGGTILDPFAGSGTTGQAARDEGFGIILIEREEEYQRDIAKRLGLPL